MVADAAAQHDTREAFFFFSFLTTTAVGHRWPPPRPARRAWRRTNAEARATGKQHQDQESQDPERAQQLHRPAGGSPDTTSVSRSWWDGPWQAGRRDQNGDPRKGHAAPQQVAGRRIRRPRWSSTTTGRGSGADRTGRHQCGTVPAVSATSRTGHSTGHQSIRNARERAG